MNDWQPINTAPTKNETEVLVTYMGAQRRVAVAYHYHNHWFTVPGGYTITPTHWHPLPELPKEQP